MGEDATPPPSWGKDPLTRYLEDAYRNRWASFALKQSASRLLVRIDRCYVTALADWANPEHPNERAITSTLSIIRSEDRAEFKQSYLVGDGLSLEHGLKSAAQAGVCALNLILIAYPTRFAEMGLADEPLELRKQL